MSKISSNIKFLRKKKGLTQQQFADQVGIKRSLVGAYEEERAEPKYELLKQLAIFFDVSIDDFINETIDEKWAPKPKGNPANLRVLSISVDKDDNENIELVPMKASAGYLNGYADPEFVAQLPKFYLPMFKQGTYRAFEIKGDSMLPLHSGSIIIGEYQENWADVKVGETYVFITKSDGVVYKRAGNKYKEGRKIKLISDNPVYEPYEIDAEDLLEVWKAKAYISTHLPQPTPEPTMESLTSMMAQMQRSIANLNKKDVN
ncbi:MULTISPECIES: XRE family transcriptional regulator [unclassified Mucilaginibacter]|uniref:XRE family transcriptional regulator n=1 Tax=unclassified Mucilaginibacter TaxID=2617802 RepID=UPI0009698F40|nr:MULTISPECIES: LexA family transcriptional regulator [unclassified Mucilaginibacter]OJW18509.1 MAG: transcriptional regulator [Mucilaginibacter sp. 44-25]PLW91056.1 MAG: transcriptional regulator [Mucilaginibacter sp.]HEK21314.1 LexA family transcriptional regulator [Bacteroidota bacterium]